MAMLTAILVGVAVTCLSLVAVQLSDHSHSLVRGDRKRVAAFHAAEAGIDHALQVIQSTPRTSLPCGQPLARTMGPAPSDSDYVVSFTYYANYPPIGAPLACPLSSAPRAVVLRSLGDTMDPIAGTRALEVTAQLTEAAGAFDKAIFSDQSIDFENSAIVAGNVADDAVVYTNGNYTCRNSQQVAGFVYAQGGASLENSCSVSLDLWAKDAITTGNGSTIGRDLISGTSSITFGNSTEVRRNARAGTTITDGNSTVVRGLRLPNSPAGPPPAVEFPEITFTPSAWVAAGYVIREYTSCSDAVTELRTLALTWTTKTVVQVTGCQLVFQNNSDIKLANDLAIVAPSGIKFQNSTKFVSSSTNEPRLLHLLVPFGSACSGASQGAILMGNSTVFESPVRTFLYTPCYVGAANSGDMVGQLYGGRVKIENSFRMTYRPVDAIPGHSVSDPSIARQVSVAYKREVASAG